MSGILVRQQLTAEGGELIFIVSFCLFFYIWCHEVQNYLLGCCTCYTFFLFGLQRTTLAAGSIPSPLV
jgi:uncharacterized membrane protein